MGNQISNLFNSNDANDPNDTTKLKPASVKQIIDYIATYYILTMDFQSLKKLYDIEYCDKLVILTSDIIERYFTEIQITYLAENIRNGKDLGKDLEKDLDLALEPKKTDKKRRRKTNKNIELVLEPVNWRETIAIDEYICSVQNVKRKMQAEYMPTAVATVVAVAVATAVATAV